MKLPGIYLHLFHGRNSPDEALEDWGFDGPTIGPLKYFHVTYGSNIKTCMPLEVARKFFPNDKDDGYYQDECKCIMVEMMIDLVGDLFEHDGKYYGDWSIAAFNESEMK